MRNQLSLVRPLSVRDASPVKPLQGATRSARLLVSCLLRSEAEELPGPEELGWGGPVSPRVAPPRRPLPPLQVAVTFAIVLGVIIYRISTAAALAMNSSPSVRSNIRVTVTATAVIINLVVIILLDEVYGCIARWLTKIGEWRKPPAATTPPPPPRRAALSRLPPALGPWAGHVPPPSPVPPRAERGGQAGRSAPCFVPFSEVPKTEKSFEERLIFKAFLLKFVNSYTPIFYVAFFKGR